MSAPLTDEELTTVRLRLANLLGLAGLAPRSPDVLLARYVLQLERERDDLRAVARDYGSVPDLESEAAQEAIETQARAMFESWRSESVELYAVNIAMCIAETQGVRTPWSRLSDAQRGAYLATADAVIALQGASAPAVPPARITELEAALAERDRRIAYAENELVRLATGLVDIYEDECEPEADPDDGHLPPDKAVDCAFRLVDAKHARIAELEETLVASHMAYDRLEARLAPPAPAPRELAEGLRKLRELIDKNAEINDSEGQQNRREVTAVCDAAESWQRLQWRPASDAPVTNATHIDSGDLPDPVLVNAGAIYIGSKSHDGRWFDVYGEELSGVLGWLPLDALLTLWLPLDALLTLNGGDDEEAPFVCPGCHAVAEALRTAAREAQVRVLEAYAKEARALDGDLLFTLRSRIERGEDL